MPPVQSLRRKPGRPEAGHPGGANALLKAAQTAFAIHGFEGASLRSISAAAGVDPALASHHFGSKEALWRAVVEHLAEPVQPKILELVALSLRVDLPVRERFEAALRQFVATLYAEPEAGMFLARVGTEKGERLDFLLEHLFRPYHDAFTPILSAAMDAGVVLKQPVEVMYFMLLNAVSMTFSYAHVLKLFGHKYRTAEALKLQVTECLLATFLPSEAHLSEQTSVSVAQIATTPRTRRKRGN